MRFWQRKNRPSMSTLKSCPPCLHRQRHRTSESCNGMIFIIGILYHHPQDNQKWRPRSFSLPRTSISANMRNKRDIWFERLPKYTKNSLSRIYRAWREVEFNGCCRSGLELMAGFTTYWNIKRRWRELYMRILTQYPDSCCFLTCTSPKSRDWCRKWDGVTISALYLTAILHRKDLGSIRDLNASHIPLLTNTRQAIINATISKWPQVSADQLRLYFHCICPSVWS